MDEQSKTPAEIFELLKAFEKTRRHEDLPQISKDELAAFLEQSYALTDEPYIGVWAQHWFADAAMLACINDHRATETFMKMSRYYE